MKAPAPDNAPLPVTKPGRFNYQTLLSRLVVLALLSASVGLIWWSYYRMLLPQLKESQELDLSVAKLTTEIDTLLGLGAAHGEQALVDALRRAVAADPAKAFAG